MILQRRTTYLLLIALHVLFACDHQESARMESRLVSALSQIQPPPNFPVTKADGFHKFGLASATSKYKSTAPWDRTYRHFAEQLTSRGWKLRRTIKVTDWGRDFGGKAALFCKDDWTAELEYQPSYPEWNYALSMSWDRNSTPCQ